LVFGDSGRSLEIERGIYDMVGYELYWRDPIRGYQLIGVLPERRRNQKRITRESVLNFGKKYFGNKLDLNEMFFLEVEIDGMSIRHS
jgi:hypothetical protein